MGTQSQQVLPQSEMVIEPGLNLPPGQPTSIGDNAFIQELIRSGAMRGPGALHAWLTAAPGRMERVESTVQASDAPAGLNDILACAFAGSEEQQRSAEQQQQQQQQQEDSGQEKQPSTTEEKNPINLSLPLPPARKDTKPLKLGTMSWELKAVDHSSARCVVNFTPNAAKVKAKNVSFVQTVLNKNGSNMTYAGANNANPVGKQAVYQPFEDPVSKKRIDHLAETENDPFYGAEWDQTKRQWRPEGSGLKIGTSKGGAATPAGMSDKPMKPTLRSGLGDSVMEFETVPMVLETAVPLGALRWGWTVKDQPNAPIILTGGEKADCTDTPTSSVQGALDQYYTSKYDAILDNFDVGSAVLKPAHLVQLGTIAGKLLADPSLHVELGGATDLTGDAKTNQKVSNDRAEAARTYLIKLGIAGARITVQSYGSDWARTQTEQGKSEGKNRRVQVRLY